MSIIHKLKKRENDKISPIKKLKTLPHQLNDVIGKDAYENQKDNLTYYQKYLS